MRSSYILEVSVPQFKKMLY